MPSSELLLDRRTQRRQRDLHRVPDVPGRAVLVIVSVDLPAPAILRQAMSACRWFKASPVVGCLRINLKATGHCVDPA